MVNKWWPLPYSGLPALLSGISMLCLTAGILLLVARICDDVAPIIIAVGFVTGLLSTGRNLRVSDGLLELKYGFPIAFIKYSIRDVVDVFDINSLGKGKLVRYFKYHLFVFSLIIALPAICLVIKGIYPNPVYLPFLFLPVFLGVILQLFMVFTAENYRKLIIRLAIALSIAWVFIGIVVGVTYLKYYSQSLFSNMTVTTMYLIEILLLAACTMLLLSILSKNHIVVIETSKNKFYAIGTLTHRDAEELLRTVVRKVVGYVETPS